MLVLRLLLRLLVVVVLLVSSMSMFDSQRLLVLLPRLVQRSIVPLRKYQLL
jgi:hypothetical protein